MPLHQSIVCLDQGARHRELGGAAGAPARTGENAIEAQCAEARPELTRLAFPLHVQRKIGAAGMLSAQVHAVSPWRTR